MEERLIKKLMSSMKCSSCGQYYKMPGIDVLGHRDDLWFLRVVCSACHAQYLVAAVVKESTTPVITDLTKAELAKFRKAGVITTDDMLDMHKFLKDFDGDFAKLLARK